MRHLPVYILIDTSGSMKGEPIESVKVGLADMIATLRQDPYALETVCISIITFDRDVNQVLPLTELENLRSKNEELQTSLQTYTNQALEAENNRKNELIKKYEKVMKEEEISDIKDKANDFSYDELESKLAIAFANKQMAGNEVKKVPLPDPEHAQFALFMEKYRID